jgi:hypothetical protein
MASWRTDSTAAEFGLDPLAEDKADFDSSLSTIFDDMSPVGINANESLQSASHNWILDPSTGQVIDSARPDNIKRARLEDDDMDKNACWKSPLCPNSKSDGSHPDHCKGECADFLFAHPESMPDDRKILSSMVARSRPRVPVSLPSNTPLKRSKVSPEGNVADSRARCYAEESSLLNPSLLILHNSAEASRTKMTTSTGTSKSLGRVPHNQVEKKYRENVNAQLEALRQAIPLKQHLASFVISPSSVGLSLDIEDLAAAASAPRQLSKAVVISSATAYIKMLESENLKLKEDLEALKGQNQTLQGLVKANCDDCSLMNYMKRWKIQGPGV